VPALADVQLGVRDALVRGDADAVAPLLSGGKVPRARLAIHERHYRTTLVTALLDRFPATIWLVGSDLVTAAASTFVREHPPSRPCIAEYGDIFPPYLQARAPESLPYLGQFAELEWHLGRLALAVDTPPLRDISLLRADGLADTRLSLQPHVHLMHLDWSLDELMAIYLSDRSPDRFELSPGDIWLRVSGLRGEIRLSRVAAADAAFLAAVADGSTVTDAALRATERESSFDAGRALVSLFTDGLVTAVHRPGMETIHG
jgi:hypothetical protein